MPEASASVYIEELIVDATQAYRVVINSEGQYSVLPAGIGNPPGWQDAGMNGSQDECLSFIGEQWTDMRPLAIRCVRPASRDSRWVSEPLPEPPPEQ